MNKIKRISVIIPCYNSSGTIGLTIKSVIGQTFKGEIELIVVDDYSSDSTVLCKIIDELKLPNNISLNLVLKDANTGGGEARNIGIEAATGDFICFLDSDDEWFEDKLILQLQQYQPGTILAGQVKKGISIASAETLPRVVKENCESVSDALFTNTKLIQTSTFFMDSDIAKIVRFNPNLPRHQDYDFLLRAEHLGYPIIQMNKLLSFWRVEDASSDRFLKKKASPEFFISWFSEYKKYMSNEAVVSYVSRNIFSACAITGKFSLFIKFYFSKMLSFKQRLQIFIGVFSWRIQKLKK